MGFWLVLVDRETGCASTEFVADRDTAWKRSLEIDDRKTFSTVIRRRPSREGDS